MFPDFAAFLLHGSIIGKMSNAARCKLSRASHDGRLSLAAGPKEHIQVYFTD